MEQQFSEEEERAKEHIKEIESSHVQRFQLGLWMFNVNRALTLIAELPRETKLLPVAPWAEFFGLDRLEGPSSSLSMLRPGFDCDYAMTTDLSEPVLVATLRNDEAEELPLLIDGTHRLYKAYVEHLAALPAYVLNADESLTIREDPFLGSTVHWPNYDRTRLMIESAEPGCSGS